MGQRAELESSFLVHLQETTVLIDRYYTPLLCLLGTVGNSLSLLVFGCDAQYRSHSASYYLSALALSDTGYLLSLFAVWLESVRELVITSDFICPLVMYLGQVTCFLSVYLIVGFSAERYVAVHYPLARARICTKSKARRIIAGITITALLLFSYTWIIARVVKLDGNFSTNFLNPEEKSPNLTTHLLPTSEENAGAVVYRCSVPDEYYHISWIANYLDTCITLLVPFLLIAYFNVSIARSLWKLRDIRQELVATTKSRLAKTPSSTSTPRSSLEEIRDTAAVAPLSNESIQTAHHHKSGSRVLTIFEPFLGKMDRSQSVNSQGEEEDSNGRNAIELKEMITTVPFYGGNEASKVKTKDRNPQHHHHLAAQSVNRDDNQVHNSLNISREQQRQRLEEKETNIGSDVLPDGEPISKEMDQIEQQQQEQSFQQQHNSAVMQSSALSTLPPSSSSEMRVTKTLLLVSSAFLILNLPLHAIRCTQFIQTLTTSHAPLNTTSTGEFDTATQPPSQLQHEQQQHFNPEANLDPDSVDLFLLPTAQLWANMLFNSNFAVNFLLYCVNGKNFRKALRKLAVTRILRRNQTLHTTSSTYFVYNNLRYNGGGGGGGCGGGGGGSGPRRVTNISQQEE